MKIKELHIQNYKSLVDLKIIEPNPFSVFVGPNGAGKSNIFEALEFLTLSNTVDGDNVLTMFGGISNIYSKTHTEKHKNINFELILDDKHKRKIDINVESSSGDVSYIGGGRTLIGRYLLDWFEKNDSTTSSKVKEQWKDALTNASGKQFFDSYSRLFVNNIKIVKQQSNQDIKLSSDCSNLEKVLKRILKDKNKREDIVDWLDLLVPGFENIDIVSEPLSGTDSLVIYEKGTNKPFTKNLLSDGTYNILSLLTAVYQSDEPQFLCIEEPENGLNPKVQKELVNLFRQKCEDEGHYIWINTHSQTIVNQLEAKELIIVDKIAGATQIKQLTDFDTSGLPMDEAWLTNTLGGGLPW